jgi:hypothetical protein
MKTIKSILIAFFITGLFLFLPSFQAVEKQLVENEYKNRIFSFSNTDFLSDASLLKKIWGVLEILFGISLSIGLTRLLSLMVLPLILEIGLGPFVFFLVMSVLLTLPVQLLNGICLLVQKQFSLGSVKTFLLTAFSFIIYISGTLISASLIPLQSKSSMCR